MYHKKIENSHTYDCYFTHFNGSRPFFVHVNTTNNEVNVYKKEDNNTYTDLVGSFYPQQVFIGQSPLNEMTKFSAGHGSKFDGNSILLKMDTYNYVFIGDMIYSFKSYHKIVSFLSPVGNNDVPYPYAIDTENNCYFLTGFNSGVLKATNNGDQYDYYYTVLRHISESENIECIYIGQERFIICSGTNPAEDYERLLERHRGPLYIKFKGEDKRPISKNEYIQLLEHYNEKVGLMPLLDVNIIEKRDI